MQPRINLLTPLGTFFHMFADCVNLIERTPTQHIWNSNQVHNMNMDSSGMVMATATSAMSAMSVASTAATASATAAMSMDGMGGACKISVRSLFQTFRRHGLTPARRCSGTGTLSTPASSPRPGASHPVACSLGPASASYSW